MDQPVYRATGEYLDWGRRPEMFKQSADVAFRQGVPYVKVHGRFHANPVSVAQWGLQHHAKYLIKHDVADEAVLLKAARWLVGSQEPKTGAWLYRYYPEFPGMRVSMPLPWVSAMAQGQAMSVLTRAYALTGDREFLGSASRALKPFSRLTSDGGVVAAFGKQPFYEEFPTTPPSFTLNGFQFALLGLYDLGRTGHSPRAMKLFGDGVATLRGALHYYDAPRFSVYHLGYLTQPGNVRYIEPGYHRYHVELLAALNNVAHSADVAKYLVKWACSSYGRADCRKAKALSRARTPA